MTDFTNVYHRRAIVPALYRITYRSDTFPQPQQKLKGRDANPIAQISNACQIPMVNHDLFETENEEGWDYTSGGNFEILPHDIWYTGVTKELKMIEDGNYPSKFKDTKVFQNLTKMVKTTNAQVETLRENGEKVIQVNSGSYFEASIAKHFGLSLVTLNGRNRCRHIVCPNKSHHHVS